MTNEVRLLARNPDAYSKFDQAIANSGIDYEMNPWSTDGLDCDLELLDELIGIALAHGVAQNTGDFARAFDCWAAVELRRAGFGHDEVWPREQMPRILSRELAMLLEIVSDGPRSATLRDHLRKWVATHSNSPRVAPTEAKVLGGVYRKQADVLIADWATGIELMVSTKTMLDSYGKNLRNRFEESFGDAINLRQRFPLGAFGFLFVVDNEVPQSDFVFLTNMLAKLVDAAGYDVTCLMLVDLEEKRIDRDSSVHRIPNELSHGRFFETLVSKVIDRTPAGRHAEVRRKRGLEVDTDAPDEAGID